MRQRTPYFLMVIAGFVIGLPSLASAASFPPASEESFVGQDKAAAVAEKNIKFIENRIASLKDNEPWKLPKLQEDLACEKEKLAELTVGDSFATVDGTMDSFGNTMAEGTFGAPGGDTGSQQATDTFLSGTD